MQETASPLLMQINDLYRLLDNIIDITSTLSKTSSHNAISAAEVSFSVSELRNKLEIQSDEVGRVVESSQQITSIGQQIADSSNAARAYSIEANKGSINSQRMLQEAYQKINQILSLT